jgi:hypothetical protein
MAPTLVTTPYYVQISPQGTTALTTTSFTPSNGEVIVVKLATWDSGSPLGAPTGGSQTYTSRVTIAPGGFNQWASIYTAIIAGSPGAMTISSTPSVSLRGSMVVERWTGAQLAATPVTNSNSGIGGAAASTSATQDGLRDDHAGSNGVDYHAYQASSGTSSQSYGLSLPTGMTWVIAAIEIQAAAAAAATLWPRRRGPNFRR